MNENTRDLLNEEILNEIKNLCVMKKGEEEYSAAVDGLVKLYKIKLDEEKAIEEFVEKQRRYSMDERQLTQQTKIGYFKIGIDIAGIVLPLIFYGIWMKKGFKFEETGTFTSATFRGLFNRFKPTK